eukprot:g2950.t1
MSIQGVHGKNVIPGDVLVNNLVDVDKKDESFLCGEGTYRKGDAIVSSRVGTFTFVDGKEGEKRTCSVRRVVAKPNIVPTVGAIITGSIERITPRFAKVTLITANGGLLRGTFSGVIRKHDVRSTDIDGVEMYKCFRPGDIVRASVLSLGDTWSYFLTTATPSLGVVSAKSSVGSDMVPKSWSEMRCPITGLVESRKVAKIPRPAQ